MTKNVLWYVFHPDFAASTGNKALMTAAEGIENVTLVDAYAEYSDFNIDVQREQDRLRAADLVVFQHPFYWYSSPALFKKWQDDVLLYGFAYPPKEGRELHGKHWLSVITTGGPDWAYRSGGYNNYSMSELLRPFQQTANLCGMRWHAPFIVHSVLPESYEGIEAATGGKLAAQTEALREQIKGLDLGERRSLEPLMPPHYQDALTKIGEGAATP